LQQRALTEKKYKDFFEEISLSKKSSKVTASALKYFGKIFCTCIACCQENVVVNEPRNRNKIH